MTNEQIKEYFNKLERNIEEFGYHLTNVLASKNAPSFFYTTGIYKNFKLPEIFISSLPQGLCAEITKNYVNSFKVGQSMPYNERIDFLTDRFPVCLIEVPISNLEEYALSSIKYYEKEDYKYLQIIFPDIDGYFPNEAGYSYDQEILREY